MAMREVDVAVVGAGFGGSLLTLLLARRGMQVALIDRTAHPRFAIGESSTPIADMILADLATEYDLPRLAPLAQYGTWRRAYPEVMRGRKRGFSYFRHEVGRPFEPQADHAHALLVAASSDDERCDTHWLRADVDQFLARQAESVGVELHENTDITGLTRTHDWRLTLQSAGRTDQLDARFLVDATGSGGFSRQWLGAGDETWRMRTNSRAIYSHFEQVEPWAEALVKCGADTAEYPFDCDAAALHHVLDGAWMWQLRFDDGRVSVGLAFGADHAARSLADPDAVWSDWLRRYPSLGTQLRDARFAATPGRLLVTGRLQRRAARAAGDGWAALPHAFGFVDPLHSTGIAATLSGVERLARLLERRAGAAEPRHYDDGLRRELELVDRLVHVAYQTLDAFDLFVPATMLYFTAAVAYENRRRAGQHGAFLCADDAELCSIIERLSAELLEARGQGPDSRRERQIWHTVRSAIAPYNTAGLCDEQARNLYRHTAAR